MEKENLVPILWSLEVQQINEKRKWNEMKKMLMSNSREFNSSYCKLQLISWHHCIKFQGRFMWRSLQDYSAWIKVELERLISTSIGLSAVANNTLVMTSCPNKWTVPRTNQSGFLLQDWLAFAQGIGQLTFYGKLQYENGGAPLEQENFAFCKVTINLKMFHL